jgi:hypothetical protein
MNKDPEVLDYLLNSMLEVTSKLEKSVASNSIEETNKIKKIMFDLNKKISEELK